MPTVTIVCEYPCVLDAHKVIPTGESSTDLAFLLDVVVVNHEAGLAFHGAAHIVVAFDNPPCWLRSCCLGDLLNSGGYCPLNVLACTTAGGTGITSVGHVDGIIVQEWQSCNVAIVILIVMVIVIVLDPAPAVRIEALRCHCCPPPRGLGRICCPVVMDATSTAALLHCWRQTRGIVP